MKIFFRILVAVYSLFAMALGVLVIFAWYNPFFLNKLYNNFTYLTSQTQYSSVIFISIAFIFILINLTFLITSVAPDKDNDVIMRKNEQGEVVISFSSINTIAVIVAERFQEVNEVKCKVIKVNDSVGLVLKVKVFVEAVIPELAENMQKKIKSTIESSTGVVKIKVDNVQSSFKPS
jgi:uncharacterized alkaline shock family protein YloU